MVNKQTKVQQEVYFLTLIQSALFCNASPCLNVLGTVIYNTKCFHKYVTSSMHGLQKKAKAFQGQ